MQTSLNASLTKEQFDFIERFQTAYNAIDHHLRKVLKAGKERTFTSLVHEFEAHNPR